MKTWNDVRPSVGTMQRKDAHIIIIFVIILCAGLSETDRTGVLRTFSVSASNSNQKHLSFCFFGLVGTVKFFWEIAR